jgi:gamma-glutamylcyclotransferase (GGCT)/AIG2-like uncharacterized protein YtfP
MTNVFTYGSLMFAPVWERVVRGQYRSALARLDAHSRHALIGETYPGVRVNPNAHVDGRVYFDVDAADVARLDDFEGDNYDRLISPVELQSGEVATAGFYLYKGPLTLTAQDWDPQWFEREGMAVFLATFCAAKGV